MPIVLLVLGAVTTLAGLVLTASGLTIRDGSFDTEVLTPGTITVIGGLVLIGLGLVVRELQRIERALAARPMPRLTRTDEAAATRTAEPATPLPPPAPMIEPPQLPAVEAPAAAAPIEDAAFESLRAKFPALAGAENSRFVDPADVSLALREAAGLREGVADLRSVAAVGRAANGAATTTRVMPRVDTNARQASASSKAKISVFNSFWPAAPRREGRTASAQAPVAAPAPAPVVQEQEPISSADAAQPPPLPEPAVSSSSAPISVLKSGVVEGMAYTLYSDGSIEAQLPQGTLRFGSISALRSHIENTA